MGERLSDDEFERLAWAGADRDPINAHLANEARRARESEQNLAKLLGVYVRRYRCGYAPIKDEAFASKCEKAISAAGVVDI